MNSKRVFDLVVGGLALLVSLPVQAAIALLVRLTSRGPVFYTSSRVGRNNDLFAMAKFRTMRVDTPELATHLLENPSDWLTPIGHLLRRTSLDELPQLLHVVTGQMSIVGPRPALFNQDDLVALRTKNGVHRLSPGITGLAQVEGRDDLSIEDKVALDLEYLHSKSLLVDAKLLARTVGAVVSQRSVRSD